jgi:hypothetical protein
VNEPRYGSGGTIGRRIIDVPVAKAMTMATPAPMAPKMSSVVPPMMPAASASVIPSGSQAMAMDSSPISKIGEWKTIDQRQRSVNNARRSKRHGYALLGAGAATAAGAYATDSTAPRGAKLLTQVVASRRGRTVTGTDGLRRTVVWNKGTAGIVDRAKFVARVAETSPNTILFGLGAGLAGVGAAHAVTAGARQGYHQKKLNQRRKDNRRSGRTGSVVKADPNIWVSNNGSKFRRPHPEETFNGNAGDYISVRRVADGTGTAQSLAGTAAAGGTALLGYEAAQRHGRGRLGLAAGAVGLAGASGGLIHRARSHTGVQVFNLNTGQSAVEGKKRYKPPARHRMDTSVHKGAGEPEARRQRRLAGTAATVSGAGALVARRGFLGAREDNRQAKNLTHEANELYERIPGRPGANMHGVIQSGRAIVLSHGNAAKLAAGIGGIGAGIGIERHARNSEKWY